MCQKAVVQVTSSVPEAPGLSFLLDPSHLHEWLGPKNDLIFRLATKMVQIPSVYSP